MSVILFHRFATNVDKQIEQKNDMKQHLSLIGLLTVFLISFTSCGEDTIIDDPKVGPEESVDKTIKWIESTLREHYLFYEDIPSNTDKTLDKEDFFYSLLSSKDGKTRDGHHYYYSSIKEYTKTKSTSKEPTYGFEFASLENEDNYFAWVLYVLPNSPAEEAGLKRGDWIVGIGDGTQNIKDLNSLHTGSAKKISIASYDSKKGFTLEKTIFLAAARHVENTPFLCDSTYYKGGQTIGYLMYHHFSRGKDETDLDDTTYDTQLIRTMKRFQEQGVSDFVLDLRYNGGGNLICAQIMTTMLAPKTALNQTFCILEGNDKQKHKTSYYQLSSKDVEETNLNLSRLYVLVSRFSASASEAVINSLIPYMGRENITIIGEQTEGKNVGMQIFGINEEYGYIISPLTFRIYNKDHKADYDNGFVPDVPYNELTLDNPLYPFGHEKDPMLAAAFKRITGEKTRTKATVPTKAATLYKLSFNPHNKGLYIYR